MSKVVLGKGLEALIPSDGGTSGAETKYRIISLDRLAPNPMQPRRDFDQAALHRLAESFRSNGVMQPLVVRQEGSSFAIIAGERRFRAAKLAGLKEVPAFVMDDVDDVGMLELALVENLQREDLNPIEMADAYRTLIEKCGLTQKQLAMRVGKSRTSVANLLRLLSLPSSIKAMIREGMLTEGHARAILALGNEVEMRRMAQSIVDDSMSVRDVERHASRVSRKRLIPKRRAPALVEAESFLRQLMGTSVRIHRGLRRRRIEIEYYSDEDLNRLLDLFRRIASRDDSLNTGETSGEEVSSGTK